MPEVTKRGNAPEIRPTRLGNVFGAVMIIGLLLLGGALLFSSVAKGPPLKMPVGIIQWSAVTGGLLFMIGMLASAALGFAQMAAQTAARTETVEKQTAELQEDLDKDFRLNLIKINFKYIDKYYFQTQSQANKSFMLSAVVSVVAFSILVFGITRTYAGGTDKTAGYVATVAGVLSQFIAAVFFYLYNRTVLKMSDYHEKLVLTQNIALALKITDELEGESKTAAQLKLIDYLAKDVNALLARPASETK